MTSSIGFMQGRLSPPVDGKIQAFPRENWRSEFPVADSLDIRLMEWTLDHVGLHENPIMTEAGRKEVSALALKHTVGIPSLTGDFIMQAPFYKETGAKRKTLLQDLSSVVQACCDLEIGLLIFPLVDNGSIESDRDARNLQDGLADLDEHLSRGGMRIVFESDLPPQELSAFIGGLPGETYGINLDMGNSAALGYDIAEELAAFGDRIHNVHVKDRLLGGTTVPLGTGAAELSRVVQSLVHMGYAGNYIMQTARAADGDHARALASYKEMIAGWLAEGSSSLEK